MTKSVASACQLNTPWTIVVDDSCPVVHKFGWLVKQWDREKQFRFVGQDSTENNAQLLVRQLQDTHWSLMLVDNEGHQWLGPDAIPFILKNLPSGKIAAVTYTVPGTMWLTRKLYDFVSRNRQQLPAAAKSRPSGYFNA